MRRRGWSLIDVGGVVVVVALVGYLAGGVLSGYWERCELEREVVSVEGEVERLERVVCELEREREEWLTDGFAVEQAIRQELLMSKQDEVVFYRLKSCVLDESALCDSWRLADVELVEFADLDELCVLDDCVEVPPPNRELVSDGGVASRGLDLPESALSMLPTS